MTKIFYYSKTYLCFIFSILTLFLAINCSNIDTGKGENKVKTIIKEVVWETEEGYIITNDRTYNLPNISTEVKMEDTAFTNLINSLKQAIGQESILYIYNETIVGLTSKDKNIIFTPKYTKRKKIIYNSPPLIKKTIMNSWDADTYRLSIKTSDGVFCVSNSYEVSDYYKKVIDKLSRHYEHGQDLKVKITILYHSHENCYECIGEVEDIKFMEK